MSGEFGIKYEHEEKKTINEEWVVVGQYGLSNSDKTLNTNSQNRSLRFFIPLVTRTAFTNYSHL